MAPSARHCDLPFSRVPGTRFSEAKWIWPRNDRRVNGHVLFRISLHLEGDPGGAWMFVAAESFARVFVDRKEVLRTSSISYPGQHYYEAVDLSDELQPGVHELAVLAWFIGVPSGASVPKDPGLLLEIVDGDGRPLCSSGANWRALSLDAWEGQIRRSHWLNLDLVEILDFRKLPADLATLPIDERFTIPEATGYPGARFIQVEPRTFAKPGGPILRHFRTFEAGVVTDLSNRFEIPSRAVLDEPIEAQDLGIRDWQAFTLKPTPPGQAWSLILDLGTYEKGFPALTATGDPGTMIDVSWFEDLTVPDARKELSKVYATDRFILSGNQDPLIPEEWKCGRYLQFTFRRIQTALTIRDLRWERSHFPLPRRATLTASSAELKRIIEIGLRSAALCMHDNIMDCPWRERRQWIGDVQRINLINYYAFGAFDLPRAVLKQHLRQQDISGRMWVCQPINEEFPSQSMEWLRAVLEFHTYSADESLLPEVSLNIELLHRWFLQCRNADGLFFVDARPVVNWMDNAYGSTISGEGGSIRKHQFRTPFLALNLRYLLFLDDVVQALGHLGQVDLVREARNERERLAGALHAHFRDASSGLYRDCADPSLPVTFSEMAHALIVRAELPGISGEDIWDRFQAYATDHAVIPATPFGKFHTFEALGKLNRAEAIVAEILLHWGPMVAADSDTAWESFDGKGSRCHGWAGIPAVALLRHVLKLEPFQAREGTVHNLSGIEWIHGQIHPSEIQKRT